jgi:hypothetical protein
MARIRTIKPEFFSDEKLVEVSFGARLLFEGLWVFGDDEGRLPYSPRRIKMQIFPGDNVDVDALLAELLRVGVVVRYMASDGAEYMQVKNFGKHQRINKPTPSRIPPPLSPGSHQIGTGSVSPPVALREDSRSTPGILREHSVTTSGVLPEDSLTERKGEVEVEKEVEKDGKGNGKVNGAAPPSPWRSQSQKSQEAAPDGLTEIEYARRLLADLTLPESGNLTSVSESICTLAKKRSISLQHAFQEMSSRAFDARLRGETVNRFWFQDGGYLGNANRSGPKNISERNLEAAAADEARKARQGE